MKLHRVMVAVAALMLAVSANAGINVNWYVTYGVYPFGAADVTSTTAGTGLLANNGSGTTILQLIYCGGNGSIDIVDPNNAGFGYVSGDDQVLETRTAVNGVGYDEWVVASPTPNPYSNPTFTAGFVYARVFQDATPAPTEHYYNTGTVALQNLATDPAFAQPLYIGDAAGNFGVALDTAIVPEPSSLLLAGVGALVVALRRRRQV